MKSSHNIGRFEYSKKSNQVTVFDVSIPAKNLLDTILDVPIAAKNIVQSRYRTFRLQQEI